MKIDQSTLSMDAYFGHREVLEVSEKEATDPRRFESEGEYFKLNLGDDAKLQNIIQDPINKVSSKVDLEEMWSNQSRGEKNKEILQQATSRVLASEIVISEVNRTNVFSSHSELISGEKYVRRPFDMFFGRTRVYEKSAHLDFSSSGEIQTEDGRIIKFSLDVSIERRETEIFYRRGRLPVFIDPLVLSFDDGLDSLSGSTFSFDLTGDDILNTVGSLAPGSGFLALDNNEDGIINNGKELFGPLTGHGFNELATYDLDDNSWIDENDPVFDKLMLWMGAGGEKEHLITLKEAGVGAIALSNLDTQFDLKDSTGNVLGNIARAGIFFMENGAPRSIQELDLALNSRTESIQAGEADLKQTIDQAIAVLQRMIQRRRNQLAFIARGLAVNHDKRESLAERFWEWQERRLLG